MHASRAGARKAQWPISVLNGSQGKERGTRGHNNKRNFEQRQSVEEAVYGRGASSNSHRSSTSESSWLQCLLVKNVADKTNLSTCVYPVCDIFTMQTSTCPISWKNLEYLRTPSNILETINNLLAFQMPPGPRGHVICWRTWGSTWRRPRRKTGRTGTRMK